MVLILTQIQQSTKIIELQSKSEQWQTFFFCFLFMVLNVYKIIARMKKNAKIIEIVNSITDCAVQSPQQKLKSISSNVSFQGNPQKIMRTIHNHHFVKRDSFALKGWENTRAVTSKEVKQKRSKRSIDVHSTRKDSEEENHRKSIYQSLQLKSDKTPSNTNFTGFRLKTSKERQHKGASVRRQTNFQQFQEHLSKQRYNLLHFYQNQRLKRRLMNDLLDPQQTVRVVQYPLAQFATPTRPKTTRKQLVRQRYFNS